MRQIIYWIDRVLRQFNVRYGYFLMHTYKRFLSVLIRTCSREKREKRHKRRGTTACLFSKLVRKCFYDVNKMKYCL